MGIYQGVMAIPADAVLLPKLVAWSVFKLPVSQVDGLATVLLQDKDRVLSSATLDFAQSEQLGAHALSSDQADALEMLNIPFELTPFRAQVGMEIRVVFESTKFHYESDVLHIVKAA
eukprot:gene30015-37162_t